MNIGTSIHADIPWVRYIHDLDDARAVESGGRHVEKLQSGGRTIGDALRSGPHVQAVRTMDLTTLVYPTKYAFSGACTIPLPFVVMTHRTLLIQVWADGKLRNVLFNPSDHPSSLATPYFHQLATRFGKRLTGMIQTKYPTPDKQLEQFGLTPEDIDLIAFDHFHVQDLRPLLGTHGTSGPAIAPLYPNARLLAPTSEWGIWEDMHPMQSAWYVHDSRKDLREEQVVLFDGDIVIGDGCVLLQTPGHTTGNQTIFCYGERGVFGCSENGCCVDNWSPSASRIPGLAAVSELQNVDVLLNSNTPQLGAEQYASMMLERSVVDPLPEDPRFVQMFSSSEVTPSLIAPGIKPTHVLKERDSGQLLSASSTQRNKHVSTR